MILVPVGLGGCFRFQLGLWDVSGPGWVWRMFLVPDEFGGCLWSRIYFRCFRSRLGADPNGVWVPLLLVEFRTVLALVPGGAITPSPLSPAESFKPGFVPPRDLSKHSPLIKSQSLISIRRVRGREDGPEPEPSPAPVPSPPPSRERRNVHRTQSVPAQSKAARRLRKQSSTEHVAEPPAEDNLGSPVPRATPVSHGSCHVTLAFGPAIRRARRR